jgi:hypothetical protein
LARFSRWLLAGLSRWLCFWLGLADGF